MMQRKQIDAKIPAQQYIIPYKGTAKPKSNYYSGNDQ